MRQKNKYIIILLVILLGIVMVTPAVLSLTMTSTFTPIPEDADTVTITLTSSSDINTSSTGIMTYIFNITTNTTAINNNSILIAQGVSPNASLVSYNWSFRIPADQLQPDEVRCHGRGEDEWYEKFNDSGTGEIGSLGEWDVVTLTNSLSITVLEWGTNYTKIQLNKPAGTMFPQIWYVDRWWQVYENKTNQYSPIYSNNMLRTEYDVTGIPSDTGSHWDWKNATYHVEFYANATSGTQPLNVYYANSSFGNENPSTSPNAVIIGSVSPGQDYVWSRMNSSYYNLIYTAVNQTVGTVNMTYTYYIIFTSAASYDDAWKLYYADNNTSHGDHYHDFLNTSVAEVSTTNGSSWYAFGNDTTEDNELWLKFDEDAGDNCVDSAETYSGHWHNGTRHDAVWTTPGYDGVNGSCLYFDGANDYVNVSNGDHLNFTTEMTVSMWINFSNTGAQDFWISKDDSFRFGTGEDRHRPRFQFYRGGWKGSQTASDIFTEGVWYHVSATFNSSRDETVMYVNGTEVQRQTGYIGDGDMDAGEGDIVIGAEYDLSNDYNGYIDNVQLWQRALSEDEIYDVYANITRKGTPDVHIVWATSAEDRVVYKVYANTTNGEEAWSITWQDLFNTSNFPPSDVSIVEPTIGETLYAVDNTTLTLSWLGDPNYDDCWMNSTLEDGDGNFITWFENRSIPGWYQQTTTTYSNYIIPSQHNLPAGQFQWNMTITDNQSASTTNILKPYYVTELKVDTPNPVDQSENNPITPTYFSIQANHSYGGHFNISWKIENCSGTLFNVTYATAGNGTYYVYNTSWVENYSTDYTWSVCINETNATGAVYWSNHTYVFGTEQAAPIISFENPSNNSYSVPITISPLNITIEDPDGDSFNYTIECSNGDTASQTDESNGSKDLIISTNLYYSTQYTWWVNVTDGTNETNATYYFTTANASNITLSFPNPSNGSTGQETALTWNITMISPDGDYFDWWINCSNGQTNNSMQNTNGSKTISLTGLAELTDYYVFVNVTNNGSNWTREYFNFSTKAQPLNVLAPFPANESVGITRPPTNISTFINGTNTNITYNYYNMTPWPNSTQKLYNWSNRNSGRYEVLNLDTNWTNSFLWGDTTYYWWVNVSSGATWVNRSYWYTTTGSRYDVTNSGDVISGDISTTWSNRQGQATYDGIYDVDSSGDIVSGDISLIWANRT